MHHFQIFLFCKKYLFASLFDEKDISANLWSFQSFKKSLDIWNQNTERFSRSQNINPYNIIFYSDNINNSDAPINQLITETKWHTSFAISKLQKFSQKCIIFDNLKLLQNWWKWSNKNENLKHDWLFDARLAKFENRQADSTDYVIRSLFCY